MTEHDQDAVVQQFRSSSGLITGVLGLATAGFVLVVALLGFDRGTPLGLAIVALLGGVLVWAAMLRPSLWVTRSDLVMRNMFHTDRIPLAAIEKVLVTQVLTVWVGGRRYQSPAVGYTVRQVVKARFNRSGVADRGRVVDRPQDYIQTRIELLAKDAAELAAVRTGSPEQEALAAGVRRSWAWLELGAAVALAVAFLVWLVVV